MGNSSFVRYVFHGEIVAAQRSCSPVVMISAFFSVVLSFRDRQSRDRAPDVGVVVAHVCSSTWHLPPSSGNSFGP